MWCKKVALANILMRNATAIAHFLGLGKCLLSIYVLTDCLFFTVYCEVSLSLGKAQYKLNLLLLDIEKDSKIFYKCY